MQPNKKMELIHRPIRYTTSRKVHCCLLFLGMLERTQISACMILQAYRKLLILGMRERD
jgi:hypothetical protein